MKYKIIEYANGDFDVMACYGFDSTWIYLESFDTYEKAKEYVRSMIPSHTVIKEEIINV